MKRIFKMFNRKRKNTNFIKQLRKDLVIEIIRKRVTESTHGIQFTYQLSVAQEAELLTLYIIGKATIDSEKLIESYNNL